MKIEIELVNLLRLRFEKLPIQIIGVLHLR